MTLDQLLAKAKHLIASNVNAYVDPQTIEMCQSIIDLFGEALPCGVETPGVNWTMVVAPAFSGTPSDARAYAAAIIRAADSVEPAGDQ